MNTVENREESSRLLLRFLSEEVIRKEVPAELWQQMEQHRRECLSGNPVIMTQMTFEGQRPGNMGSHSEHRQAISVCVDRDRG